LVFVANPLHFVQNASSHQALLMKQSPEGAISLSPEHLHIPDGCTAASNPHAVHWFSAGPLHSLQV
jgi:hypothetical protein